MARAAFVSAGLNGFGNIVSPHVTEEEHGLAHECISVDTLMDGTLRLAFHISATSALHVWIFL